MDGPHPRYPQEGRLQSTVPLVNGSESCSSSQETVTWLLTQKKGDVAPPKDVSIDWTVVSGNALLLDDVARLMLDRYHCDAPPGEARTLDGIAIVGIALSGVPLATLIAASEQARFAVYHPAKHSPAEHPTGSLEKLIDAIGSQHIIFGSNAPIFYPYANVFRVMNSKISDEDRERILWINAEGLLR